MKIIIEYPEHSYQHLEMLREETKRMFDLSLYVMNNEKVSCYYANKLAIYSALLSKDFQWLHKEYYWNK